MDDKLTKSKKQEIKREWRWWKINPDKLVKLEQAFAIGCTDIEAMGYADISETQFYYYERLNPDWKRRKQILKDQLVLKARQTVANKLGESYGTAIDYLKRRKRDEFGDNMDLTTKGNELPGSSDLIIFKDFDGTRSDKKI